MYTLESRGLFWHREIITTFPFTDSVIADGRDRVAVTQLKYAKEDLTVGDLEKYFGFK